MGARGGLSCDMNGSGLTVGRAESAGIHRDRGIVDINVVQACACMTVRQVCGATPFTCCPLHYATSDAATHSPHARVKLQGYSALAPDPPLGRL